MSKETMIGFIGCGNMGGALARAAAASFDGSRILIAEANTDLAAERAAELGVTASDSKTVAELCRIIFLAVKPHLISTVLDEIYPVLLARNDRVLLVSVAAGVSIWSIRRSMETVKLPLIRMMPNTPVSVGAGMIVYATTEEVNGEDETLFRAVLAKAGKVDKVTEGQIDAAGALSGCGPAFVCLFMEALADAGVECGLTRTQALTYAEQTLLGTAKLAQETGLHPGVLKDQVCSPGGTTIAGVHALESDGFRAAVMDAVSAAMEKTRKLSKN